MRADPPTLRRAGGLLAVGIATACLLPRTLALPWLAAMFFWSGVPVGSLGLLLMMRLIGGEWRAALGQAMVGGTRALPVAALAAVPVLVAMGTLYPWVADRPEGFKGWWLAPLPFVLRSLVWFGGLAATLFLYPRRPRVAATVGLLFLVPMGSLAAVDWLLSLDPGFHSSGFGLQALAVQFTVALAVAILRGRADPTGTTGALLLTILLFWGYFGYLQFFIVWSGDAPAGAHWYGVRARYGWEVVEALAVALHGGPLLALFSPTVRRSREWLRALAVAVLVGDACHVAWLVLPAAGAVSLAGLLLFAVAVGVIGAPTLLLGKPR